MRVLRWGVGNRQGTVLAALTIAAALSAAGCVADGASERLQNAAARATADPLASGNGAPTATVEAGRYRAFIEAERRLAREFTHGDRFGPPCSINGPGGSTTQPILQWRLSGSELLFIHGGHLYAVAVDGSRLQRLVDAPVDDTPPVDGPGLHAGQVTAADVSPDGTRVVYGTCRDYGQWVNASGPVRPNRYEILVWPPAPMTPEPLAVGWVPVWSPDGTRIAFIGVPIPGRPADLYTLHTVTPGGSDQRRLATAMRFIWPPQWAPDAERLAFVREDREVGYAVYIVGADSTDLQRLTEAASGPSWSPDGQRIAFAKPEQTEVALYTIAADGSDAQRVTTIEGWELRNKGLDPARAWIETVAWSPAGGQILYTCGLAVCVVDLDGAPVGTSPIHTDAPVPAWSPDGARIAIVNTGLRDPNLGHHGVVYTMAPDGTDVRVLVRNDPDASVQWVGARRSAGPVERAGCAAGAAVPDPAAHPGLVQDCETLLEMRDVLAGGASLNWTADRPLASWDGVRLGGAPLRVQELRLSQSQLRGIAPPAIGRLSDLRVLDLWNNRLTGSMPPELGQLANLRRLSLGGNQLTGPIPAELGHLANLEQLSLDGNQLTGTIPVELGHLANLEWLSLARNQLTGTIPPELGHLANLEQLSLDGNQLTGTIPAELGHLANLEWLYLDGNQLTGTIPAELGQLASLRLLYLDRNQLTGTIPAEFGQLANLEWLYLAGNQLTGCIPSALHGVRESDLPGLGLPDCE